MLAHILHDEYRPPWHTILPLTLAVANAAGFWVLSECVGPKTRGTALAGRAAAPPPPAPPRGSHSSASLWRPLPQPTPRPLVPEGFVVYAYLAYAATSLFSFCLRVIDEICDALDISCFRIRTKGQ